MEAHTGCLAAAVVGALATATTASAQEPLPPPPPTLQPPGTTVTREVWYGEPMLATEVTSVALVAAGLELWSANLALFGTSTPSENRAADVGGALLLGGYAGFVLGPPIEHWLHGHGERGAQSLLLRLLVPPAALLSGMGLTTLACGNRTGCGDAAMGTMLGGAVLGTILVDDVLGARQSVPIRPSDGSLRVVPQVTVGRFTSVGLAAEF